MFGLFDKASIQIHIPQYILMEESFESIFDIVPKSRVDLRQIEVELFCRETGIYRGTSDSYNHKNVYSDLRYPHKQITLQQDKPLQIRETFQLPPLTTPSFHGRNFFIRWYVRIRLDVPWWPDTRYEKELNIFPYLVAS